jgi:cytochrome c551/c552
VENTENKRTLIIPLIISGVILAFVAAIFLLELFSFDPTLTAEQTSEDVEAAVSALLVEADPSRGDALLVQYGCAACHRLGVDANVAPSFVGIAQRAATRRPPLSAQAYLYESIRNPSAFVVEEYSNAMPQNYGERITQDDLRDMIAYLLSPEAQ